MTEIVEMGEIGAASKLQEARNKMPEPSRWKGQHFRVPILPTFKTMFYDPTNCGVGLTTFPTYETIDFEKVLLNEGGASFWAWRHIGSQLVIR